MSRPLVITDCDEVLLHMVAPFRDWLGEAHAIDFAFDAPDFTTALTRRESGETFKNPVKPATLRWRS